MALTKYGNLQFRYNSYEDVEVKDFLPIIENEIPNKLIANFDEAVLFTVAGGGLIDYVILDKTKAYKSTACTKVPIGGAGYGATCTYTPPTSIDMFSISTVTKNYAVVKQSGKYLSGGTSYKDTFHFVLNIGHYYESSAATPAKISLVFYNGTKTATLKSAEQKALADSTVYVRNTYQFAMDDTHFDYAGGFTAADWEAITKFDIVIIEGNEAINIYLHNANVALPKFETTHCEDSYYPETTDTNSIFVCSLFGTNSNAGTRAAPVRTIEYALYLIDAAAAGFVNVVIMDSETYKPISAVTADGYTGLQQTLDRHTAIRADYLETPNISCEPGLFNADRVGARDNNRTLYYRSADANKLYVAKTGVDATGTKGDPTLPYLTIAGANADATAEDCIEIMDSGTYNETLVADKHIDIQAAPGQKPIWTYTSGATTVNATSYCVGLRGIIFVGNGAASEIRVIVKTHGAKREYIEDCTFKNIGAATGTATAIKNISTTEEQHYINNCLFIDNGENFIAIENMSGAAGYLYIKNCVGYMGATANNYFVKAGKATAAYPLVITIHGNKFIASSTTAMTALPLVVSFSDSAAAAQQTRLYFFLNDISGAGILINKANAVLFDTENIENNYFHDFSLAVASKIISVVNINSGSDPIINVQKNIFNNIIRVGTVSVYCLYFSSPFATSIHFNGWNNIFLNCDIGLGHYGGDYDFYNFQNVFYGCRIGASSERQEPSDVVGCIFVNNTTGIGEVGWAGYINIMNTVQFNSPNTIQFPTGFGGNSVENPNFVDPDNLNFGWSFDSVIESDFTKYGAWLSKFINPGGAFDLTLQFLDLQGFTGQSISTAAAHIKPQYCNIHDFTVALNSVSAQISPQYCLFENNGIAMRYNNATINTVPNCKYNIMDGNNTGILLRSGAAIDHCTIVNGDYGIAGVFSGYYALTEYISDYLTITNNIIFDNNVIDYQYNLPTDYCIIGRRYYDLLPVDDINYKDTTGEHDITDNPTLTDTYFPGLKILGYKTNSPAYNAASTATQNIGARYLNRINAATAYSSYTFDANPQGYGVRMEPVNMESVTDTSGNYTAVVDAYAVTIAFEWTEPGRLSKIMSQQKTAMEYIYQTYWIVGISTDDGASWVYYKINKEVNPQTKQIGFYYNELPWGEWSMEFHKMPADFLIADYTVNTMED